MNEPLNFPSRFLVGIDLGTTNTVLAYLDRYEKNPKIKIFPILQVSQPGELTKDICLPSFCYLLNSAEVRSNLFQLPWDRGKPKPYVVGRFARDQGGVVPGRQIASAKSWLAHSGVDRTQPILPWSSELTDCKYSPVEISSFYLLHLREAWNYEMGHLQDHDGTPCTLENQQVTITVPASFDETARELTVQAAKLAGYQHVRLMEEPLAAFYAWISIHTHDWKTILKPQENVLVIDIGGGTTDFSLIKIDDHYQLKRTAVGDHILLGGDNIDRTLVYELEKEWQVSLDANDWVMLQQLCRQAKEKLLTNNSLEETEIVLFRQGKSVIGNALYGKLTQNHLHSIIRHGFLPLCSFQDPPPQRPSGIRRMGLPYASDPAISKHLLQFLRYATRIEKPETQLIFPHHVLFNGGVLTPPWIREQILDILANWFSGQRPHELLSPDFSLAVAMGAVYGMQGQKGDGVKIQSGLSHTCYLEIYSPTQEKKLICILPRDTEENTQLTIPQKLELRTNQAVRLKLFVSSVRLTDRPGDIITMDNPDEFRELPPLYTTFQYGKGTIEKIPVQIMAELTPTGTLSLYLQAQTTGHLWPLSFDLREDPSILPHNVPMISVNYTQDMIQQCIETLRIYFSMSNLDNRIFQNLENILKLPRSEWPLPILRELGDWLLAHQEIAKQSSPHEERWYQLTSFCLRPGFGDPEDPQRMRNAWKLWISGLHFPKAPTGIAQWWIFWRRISAGLKEGQQQQIINSLLKILLPQGQYRTNIKEGEYVRREMWRTLGSMEKLSTKQKVYVGNLLVERGHRLQDTDLWVLGRLGSRCLFHANLNYVIPAAWIEPWILKLISFSPSEQLKKHYLFSLKLLCTNVEDRTLNIHPELQEKVLQWGRQHGADQSWEEWIRNGPKENMVPHSSDFFGETLPPGLELA